MQKLIANIFFINVLCDVLLVFTGYVAIIRVLFLLLVITYFLVNYRGRHFHYSWMLILVIYTVLLIPFSRDPILSILSSLRVLMPMLGLMIGFHFFNTESRILYLAKTVRNALILLVLNFIIANLFGLGESTYTSGKGFLLGSMTNNWGLFSYCVLFFPLILFETEELKSRIISIGAILFNMMLVLLSITRTAIAVMVLGAISNFFLCYPIKKSAKAIISISLVLLAAFPLVQDTFFERFSAREHRLRSDSLEKEGRYLETMYVWEKALDFKEPARNFFGLEAFNSIRNYGPKKVLIFGDRNIHIDYNLIVNTIGFVGLLIYFLMYIQIAVRFRKYAKKTITKSTFEKRLNGVFITFFCLQFVSSIGGAMHQISFRLIIYLTLGACIGYFFNKWKQSTANQSTQ